MVSSEALAYKNPKDASFLLHVLCLMLAVGRRPWALGVSWLVAQWSLGYGLASEPPWVWFLPLTLYLQLIPGFPDSQVAEEGNRQGLLGQCQHEGLTRELHSLKRRQMLDFPCGTVVKNPSASARDMGSVPGPGSSHMPWSNWARAPQLLSLCSGAASHNYWARAPQLREPAHLEPMFHNKRSHRNEKPTHRNEEQPPLTATRESPRAATKIQCSQK